MISSVRRDCQATSSSISQLTFNLFGYFVSPILTGFIMDAFIDKKQGFIWGMRVVFWWVVFSLTFMILSFVLVYKKYKKKTPSDEKELNNEDMEEAIAEFMKLEIMRRLAQGSV
jgi:MFS family permease